MLLQVPAVLAQASSERGRRLLRQVESQASSIFGDLFMWKKLKNLASSQDNIQAAQMTMASEDAKE